jgi:hypothetical protein
MAMNPIFKHLPSELVDRVMTFRSEQICLNLTTGEYLHNFKTRHLKALLKKTTKRDAICVEDIGESHWKRNDKIIIVPLHLEHYVKNTYCKLYINPQG